MKPIAVYVRGKKYQEVESKLESLLRNVSCSLEKVSRPEKKKATCAGTAVDVRRSTISIWPSTLPIPIRCAEIAYTRNVKNGPHRDSLNDEESLHSEGSEDKIDPRVKVIRPASSLFSDALSFRTYRLADRDQTHKDAILQRIFKLQKRLQVHLREQVFDASSPISFPVILRDRQDSL